MSIINSLASPPVIPGSSKLESLEVNKAKFSEISGLSNLLQTKIITKTEISTNLPVTYPASACLGGLIIRNPPGSISQDTFPEPSIVAPLINDLQVGSSFEFTLIAQGTAIGYEAAPETNITFLGALANTSLQDLPNQGSATFVYRFTDITPGDEKAEMYYTGQVLLGAG